MVSAEAQRTQLQQFLSISKTLSDNLPGSAVLFKHWRELECQTFLTK
jgi:hypothetical protein